MEITITIPVDRQLITEFAKKNGGAIEFWHKLLGEGFVKDEVANVKKLVEVLLLIDDSKILSVRFAHAYIRA